jgi:Ni,Fe-hydrogenase I large subunit
MGHWVRIEKGRIANYQVITPTAWNASPRDAAGNLGPMEQAAIGTPVSDEANLVEVQHIIRSFDPCLACAIHVLDANGRESVTP